MRDEARWDQARRAAVFGAAVERYDGLTDIAELLTPDQIADLDNRLAARAAVGEAPA